MKHNQLNILYTFNKEIIGQSYSIVRVFDEQSFVELEKNEMSFNDLEGLAAFCIELLEEFKISYGYMISSTEFNSAISSSVKNEHDFSELFEKFGTRIESSDPDSKKGIFDRIFN